MVTDTINMEASSMIRVPSSDCEQACLKSIEDEEAGVKDCWEDRISQEMTKEPFLWFWNLPAKTREEAVERIKADYNSHDIGASFRQPGIGERWRIGEIRRILSMCQRADWIILNDKDYALIGYHLPKIGSGNYRAR